MKGSQPETIVLRNVRAVLPERLIEKGSLVLEGGRIARIFEVPNADSSTTAASLDLESLTLFPGFIDVHIHGAVGVDTMAATSMDLARLSQFLAGQGVTAWLPTLVPAERQNYVSALQAIDELMDQQSRDLVPLGARVLGVHYEGPFVNAAQCGALHREHFQTFSGAEAIDILPALSNKRAIKMMTVAPEVEGGIDLVRELTHRGWVISIGHTRARVDVLDEAFEAGARHMTHFMNAMAPLHHRAPGPIGWGLSRNDVTCDLIADGVHLDPYMLRLLLRIKGPERLSLISDSIAAAGLGDGEYQIWGETIAVKKGRTQNAQGSIAGSVITILDAVRMILSLGATEVAVAQMASMNPARLLGIGGDCGSIEEGKRADLVALDSQGNVRLTMICGQIAFEAA